MKKIIVLLAVFLLSVCVFGQNSDSKTTITISKEIITNDEWNSLFSTFISDSRPKTYMDILEHYKAMPRLIKNEDDFKNMAILSVISLYLSKFTILKSIESTNYEHIADLIDTHNNLHSYFSELLTDEKYIVTAYSGFCKFKESSEFNLYDTDTIGFINKLDILHLLNTEKEKLQENPNDISEYFGLTEGVYVYESDYTPTGGKINTEEVTVSIIKSEEEKITVSHTTRYVDLLGLTKTEIYEVYSDKVVWVSSTNPFGQTKKHSEIIMKPIGQIWKVEVDGEYYIYTSAPVSRDGVEFLGIMKETYVRDQLYSTETYYYAMWTGLVFTIYTLPGDSKMPPRILKNIKTSS
ncbi:MAG: hypothetical protein LBI60_05005 [Bacteroidales bacterium]|jgi:hypothetical protein|nr:hypothetical protein [Bacteroidales bacterium]